MVNGIIRWCLNNHFLVFLFTAITLGFGWYCLVNTPVDAIPDIGEKQVIVFADWPGRSPQDVEDQVTYPLTVSLQGTPGVQDDPIGVRLRLLDDLRDLQGRSRLLLGSLARPGTDERRGDKTSARRDPGPRTGRDGAGPDLLVHAWKPTASTWGSCGRCRTGTSATNCSRSRASPKSRASAASSSSIKSTCIPTSCGPIA